MKRLSLLLLLLTPLALCAQEVVEENITIVDDEACGCELFFVDSIQTTKRNDLFGFKLADGRELVEPRYMYVDQWHGDYCVVYHDYYQTGLLNRRGQEVVPPIYDEVAYPSDGMIRVRQGDFYGFLTEEGQPAIPAQYDAASTFSEGLAVVRIIIDSHFFEYVFIDHEGRIVLRNDWQYAYPFFNGYAVVKKYDKFGLIDHTGRECVTTKHELLTAVDTNGLYVADDPHDGLLALYSVRNFRPITPHQYDDFLGYGDGFYCFRREDKQGFLDTQGQERFGLYDKVNPFVKGYATVSRGEHYGIIDSEGNIVLPLEYEYSVMCNNCYRFMEGRAVVMKNGKYGFIDETGQVVIPIEYERCFGFSQGRAPVQLNGKWGYIDTEGVLVVPHIFDAASPFKYGRAEVYYQGHTSKINPDGRCVKACQGFPVWRIVNIEDLQK